MKSIYHDKESECHMGRTVCESVRVTEWGECLSSMHEGLHVSKCVCACVCVYTGAYGAVCVAAVCIISVCVRPVPLPAHQWVAGPSSLAKTSVFYQEDSHRKVGHTEILSGLIQYPEWKFTEIFISQENAHTRLVMTATKESEDCRVTECDVKAGGMITRDLSSPSSPDKHWNCQ